MEQQERWLVWSNRVEAWQKSGQSQAEFSRQNNLQAKTLSAWVCRFKKAASVPSAAISATTTITSTTPSTTAPALVPVRIITNQRPTHASPNPSSLSSATPATPSAIFLTHPNGWRVQLSHVDAPWLAQLLRDL